MDGVGLFSGWAVALLLAGCAGAPPAVSPQPPAQPPAAAEAPAASPETSQLRTRLGIDDLLNGDRGLAAAQFEKAVELDPGNPTARRLLDLIQADDPAAARDALLKGIELLNEGEPERAREQLVAVLCSGPDSALARNLLEQIQADPRMVLGEESFSYTVQPGESLSRIAQRFVGDKYRFYLLARYNGIDNPSQLKAGQVIQVPGTPPPPAERADTQAPIARATPAGGSHGGPLWVELAAEDDLDPAPALFFTLDGVLPRAGEATRYMEPIEIRETATLRFLAEDGAGNTSAVFEETYRVAVGPTPAEDDQTVAGLYQQGLSAVERGAREEALELFDRVLQREPGHSGALRTRARVAAEGVDDWYRKAYAALRRQRPGETVAYCDRVLAVDPTHRNAQVLRMQALDLIAHLVEVDLAEARSALRGGRHGEAGAHARRVLALDPDNAAAAELLRLAQPATQR